MTRLSAIFFCLFLSAFFANAASGENAVDTDKTASKEYCASAYNPCHGGDILKYFANPQMASLDAQEREMIACAVLSSTRNLRELKAVVEAALDRGASALALRQSILSAAPYSGMPACIDALAVFYSALSKKRTDIAEGLESRNGGRAVKEGGVYAKMCKEFERVGAERIVLDFVCRGNLPSSPESPILSESHRQLIAYCIMCALGADGKLLGDQYRKAIMAGNSAGKVRSAVLQCVRYIGILRACAALDAIDNGAVKEEGCGNFVRLSLIEVHAEDLGKYKEILKEEIDSSMALEPGVLTLYAVSSKKDPAHITILEIYADKASYKKHLETPHFKKYKESTLKMVKDLKLIDVDPLIPGLKIK